MDFDADRRRLGAIPSTRDEERRNHVGGVGRDDAAGLIGTKNEERRSR
jgi:hypothetical protein